MAREWWLKLSLLSAHCPNRLRDSRLLREGFPGVRCDEGLLNKGEETTPGKVNSVAAGPEL